VELTLLTKALEFHIAVIHETGGNARLVPTMDPRYLKEIGNLQPVTDTWQPQKTPHSGGVWKLIPIEY
jgi:hypothetical protein